MRLTASGIARVRACASSAALARAETHSVWADKGHEDHETLADGLLDPTHEFAHLIPPDARAEVKLAYDVATRTGRIIGEGGGRDYGAIGPFEIPGSVDVLGTDDIEIRRIADDAFAEGRIDEGKKILEEINASALTGGRRTAIVIDWKTGFADVEPAKSNDQLWFYALAASSAMGLDSARIMIVYTQTGRVDSHDIGPLELAEFANTLAGLHPSVADRIRRHAAGEILDTREGSWCKHCPSKAVCPSKNALLVQMASGGLARVGDSAMTADRAAGAYRQVAAAEQLVKDARKRLEQYVDDNGPIDLGDGRMYGRFHRKGNERLDGAIAVTAIRDVVGESAREFESLAIERSTTKAAIKRAAEQLQAVKPGKLATAVIGRIRELGGITSSATRPIGEYQAASQLQIVPDQTDVADADRLLESA